MAIINTHLKTLKAGRRFILSIFLFLLLAPLSGQTLEEVHQQYRAVMPTLKKDTASINRLLEYGFDISELDGDSALSLGRKAAIMSQQLSYDYGKGKAALLQGVVYSDRGLYDTAKQLYESAIPYFERTNNQLELGKAYNNLGNLRTFQGFLHESMELYLKSAAAFEKTTSTKYLPFLYTNIAIVFQKLDQPEKCLIYLDKAEVIARKNKDTVRIINTLISKAVSLGQLNKEEESFHVTMEAMRLSDLRHYLTGMYVTRQNIADDYIDYKKYDSALYYLRAAEPLAIQSGDPYYLSGVYLCFAKAYGMQKDFVKAKDLFLKAVDIAIPIREKHSLLKAYAGLTEIYFELGRKEKGREAFVKYQLYSDSLRSDEVSDQVNTLETRFRTLEKDKAISEKELAIAHKDLELKEKNNLIIIISGGLLALLLLVGIAWLSHRQKQQLQAQKMISFQQEHELAILKAMIDGEERERNRIARNLHDGVGSLLSAARLNIDSLVIQSRHLNAVPAYRESLDLLKDASKEIRETAHNLLPMILQEQGLQEAVKAFCIRLGNSHRLSIEFHSIGDAVRFNHHFELIVYRTIQELLNNVIKHAAASHVLVQLSFHGNLFSLTVEDDGIGFSPDALNPGSGVGIYDLNKRMQAFGGKAEIGSSAGGTSVNIEFEVAAVLHS